MLAPRDIMQRNASQCPCERLHELSASSMARDQGHEEENEEDNKEDFCDASGAGRNASEPQHCCNKRDDEKYHCIVQQVLPPFEYLWEATLESACHYINPNLKCRGPSYDSKSR
jgi:hypothetical protein